ncbi:hypothetical protein SEUCBS140593_010217 [Sporothrix eucalyptigena]|uniref:Uncharacterized protein n=1 Tax=Sporothrix eucalyptigena TaxID=1812306 RepID=A0ABP0D2D7_9PEZI
MFRAVLSAFATIQASTTAARVHYKRYYGQAVAALDDRVDSGAPGGKHSDMRHALLLTGQLQMASANLEKATGSSSSRAVSMRSVQSNSISSRGFAYLMQGWPQLAARICWSTTYHASSALDAEPRSPEDTAAHNG